MKKNDLKILRFPNSISNLERQVEAILFAAEEPLDIESIKDQLAKTDPDKTTIGHLWKRVQEIAKVGGFLDAVTKLTPMIMCLLPQ